MTARIGLSPMCDVASAASEFARIGRIRIRDILTTDSAQRLHDCLRHEVPWQLAYDQNGKPMVIAASEAARQQDFMQRVLMQAKQRFQYLYCSYPMVTAYLQRAQPGLLLHEALEWLNEPATLDVIRRITGIASIRKADAQATLYRPGHFLTLHDDLGTANEQRRVAYVLNLTRRWQADWGGLLHFVNEDGEIVDSWLPQFNTLALFRVPIRHTVSYVAPFADEPRFAITGWFREV